jgi:hypothetical protein
VTGIEANFMGKGIAMNWDQIEVKWAAMARRVRSDLPDAGPDADPDSGPDLEPEMGSEIGSEMEPEPGFPVQDPQPNTPLPGDIPPTPQPDLPPPVPGLPDEPRLKAG